MIHWDNSLQDNIDISQWPDTLNITSEEIAKYFVERFYKSGIIKLTWIINSWKVELIRIKETWDIKLIVDNPITKSKNSGYLFDEYDFKKAQQKVLDIFKLFQNIKKEKENFKKRVKENKNYLYWPHSWIWNDSYNKWRNFNEKNLTSKVNNVIQKNEKDKLLLWKSEKQKKKINSILESQELINKGYKKMHREYRRVINTYGWKDFERKLMKFIQKEWIQKDDLIYKWSSDAFDGFKKFRIDLRFAGRDINVSIYRSIILLLLWNKCCVTWKEWTKYVLSRDKDWWKHLDLLTEDWSILTIDHKIPISKWWTGSIENLQVMIAELNWRKWNKLDITNTQLKDSQEFYLWI